MISIANYLPFQPTAGQSEVMHRLEAFFESSDRVFILQGYAGTGKTTLLKAVLDYLDQKRLDYGLMATTGRAARVLSLKTGRPASTIHSAIYQVDAERTEISDRRKAIAFRLRNNDDDNTTLYFIDEASMISDRSESNPLLLFENGSILEHIFRFAGERKVVFVGDDAQLPPVNCPSSPALDAGYLMRKYGLKVQHYCLTDVTRQSTACGILFNATRLREVLTSDRTPPVSIDANRWADLHVLPNVWKMIDEYVQSITRFGVHSSVFVAFSNKAVAYLNQEIRKKLYKMPNPPLQNNEWLMVVHNNAQTGYCNGQHIWLRSFTDIGERVGPLLLLNATVEDAETKQSQEVKIVSDLLYRPEPGLSLEEEMAFSIDFAIRMRKKGIKPGTSDYLLYLMKDERLNALRVKFGYAATCHKAQGGEWEYVFLNVEPVLQMIPVREQYRWLYTAITRATTNLLLPKHSILY